MPIQVVKAACCLAFFTVVLPVLLTFAHLRYYIHSTSILYVPTCWIKEKAFQGAYVRNPFMNVNDHDVLESSSSGNNAAWPSIVQVASALKQSAQRQYWHPPQQNDDSNRNQKIIYKNKTWCVVDENENMIACSSAESNSNLLYPTSGNWKRIDTDEFLEVFCFEREKSSSFLKSRFTTTATTRLLPETDTTRAQQQEEKANILEGVRKNPNKLSSNYRKRNQSLDFFLRHPATVLLLALNIGLAVVYWNCHVHPSSVAKVYCKILNNHELWRSFSGATAHFDALHIAFNMMSLYSLGQELENFGVYPSIEFLLYNVSLIPLTTCVFLMLVYARIRYESNHEHRHTSTVGYSGILFAWMVVSCLERTDATCPIPMFPDVCFETYSLFWGLKFNLSPLIQLIVAQFIMKRVSFLGHLSGIIIGFLLHWKFLPLEYIQPAVLLPFILVLHYSFGRSPPLFKLPAPIERLLPGHHDDEELAEQSDNRWGGIRLGRRHEHNDDELFHSTLLYVRNAMAFIGVAGMWHFKSRSIALSYCLVTLLFWCAVGRHKDWCTTVKSGSGKQQTDETDRLNTLYKGYVVTSIVLIITDSMTLSGWLAVWSTRSIFFWHDTATWAMVLCLWMFRILIQLLATCLVIKHVYDLDETGGGGIFAAVFGWTILDHAKVLGRNLFRLVSSRGQSSSMGPFEGRGIALGSRGDGSEPANESRLIRGHQDGQQQLSHLL